MGKRKEINHERIIEMHLEGKMGSEIAGELNCSKETVCKALKKAGYSMRFGTDKGKVIALARAGWKHKDIAWDMGITEEEVRQVLSEKAKEVRNV